MPFLTKDNIKEAFEQIKEGNPERNAKFVREDDKIFWKSYLPGVFHANLIEEAGFTHPQDAGFFEAIEQNSQKELLVNGRSSSLPLPAKPYDRQETLTLLNDLFQGKEIKIIT